MLRIITCLTVFFIPLLALAEALPVSNIADGVYVHQGVHEDLSEGYHGDISNISFVVGTKGVAIIDTGGDLKVGQGLREAVRKVTPLPILFVINTHVHPDHIFGNAAFVQDQPVFVGHAKLAEAMERRRESYMRLNQDWLGAAFAGSEIVKPSLAVDKSTTLDIGERTLTVSAYPMAHTNTDVTVLDSASKTLWTGDLLFIQRTPSIDGDLKGWLAVIDQLKQIPALHVVPGHGTVSDDLVSALNNEQRYLSTLLNDVRSSIKHGIVMEKTMDTAAASEKDKWTLFDIVNRRNVNNIYPGLEWE